VIDEISLSQPNDDSGDHPDQLESDDVGQHMTEAASIVIPNERNTFLSQDDANDDDSEQTYIDVPMDEEEEKQEAIDEAYVLPVVGYDPIRDHENIFLPPLKMK
jgi:hypothetical protein